MSDTRTVTGIVEKVDSNFKGALIIGGTKYNNKKGFVNPAKVGDQVKVTLQDVEFQGKKYPNIIAVDILASQMAQPPVASPVAKGRDFDKENKGKTKCVLLEALLSNPNVDHTKLEGLFTIVDKCVEYVFS